MNTSIENSLLATHISNNQNFESACLTGNAKLIMEIVQTEMNVHNLHTKGSNKLRDDIYRLTRGKQIISTAAGTQILSFVWNARLSGTGFAVNNFARC